MRVELSPREQYLAGLVRHELSTAETVTFQRLTGGASRETLLATVGDTRRLVLRIDRGGGADRASLHLEAEMMAAAADSGVPVPRVHAVGADAEIGDYMLMEHLEGETIARRILRDAAFASARVGLARSLGNVIARIHSIRQTSAELPPAEDPLEALLRLGAQGGVPRSGLALGMRWLRDHRPKPAATCLVHGDFRLGNLLIGPEGLRAVLDWELVHWGDPIEDLGWLCAKVWRFGAALPVAGVGTREELLEGYEEIAGWRPDTEQLRWWELYATVKWGLLCAVQANRHLSGAEPSLEFAAIGRRAVEQEFDVLLALGIEEPRAHPDVLEAPVETKVEPYGRPTIVDLMNGLLVYLTDEAIPAGGELGFHARVASNVIRMVLRELRLGDLHRDRHRQRLSMLGLRDEAELAEAILAGSLDDRYDQVVSVVRGAVRDRLSVANPDHFARPA